MQHAAARLSEWLNNQTVPPLTCVLYSLLYLVTVAPLVSSGSEKVTVSERLDVTWRVTSVGGAGGAVQKREEREEGVKREGEEENEKKRKNMLQLNARCACLHTCIPI